MEETGEASGHSEDVERPMAPGPMEVSEDDARILGMEASLELTEISATMDTSNPSKKGRPGWNPSNPAWLRLSRLNKVLCQVQVATKALAQRQTAPLGKVRIVRCFV
jgi:hypothetical protein